MRKSFKSFLREWDQDSFDFNDLSNPPSKKETKKIEYPKITQKQPEGYANGLDTLNTVYKVLAILLGGMLLAFLILAVIELPAFGSSDTPVLNEVVRRYVEEGMQETGAVNTVAGMILDYRAFDTLGESHVLYTALTAVLILLWNPKKKEEKDIGEELCKKDPIVRYTATVLVPILVTFGIYIICNGHLGPGGGFSGGSIIGAGLILYAVAFGFEKLSKILNMKTFRIIVLIALCFYSLSKCYSFFCGANHLESFIKPGTPGKIFSAGLILPLNAAVGIVVACTMYGLYSIFRRGDI